MKLNAWLTLITILIIGYQVYGCGGCLEEEKLALLQLKAFLNISDLYSWSDNKTSDCCDGSWDGVTCGTHKRVVSISLSVWTEEKTEQQNFNASILLPLQQLQELELRRHSLLSWTEVKGAPKLSTSLKRLTKLVLVENKFDASILSQLHGFQSLKYLDLRHNHLTGSIQVDDIEAISKNLEELYLPLNSINDLIFSKGCGQMQKLKILDLSYTKLARFPSCLGSLTSLQALNLSANQLSGEIPSWFQNFTALEKLNLAGNQLTGNIALSPLVHLLSLNSLKISHNDFQIPISFKSFANHTKLKYFAGDANRIIENDKNFTLELQLEALSMSDCGLLAYPFFLGNQHNLRYIDLSDNPIRGEFPAWLLQNNPRLYTLFLRNISLTGTLQLPASLRHANINQIDIRQNKIRGHIPENISVAFPGLRDLVMSYNDIRGDISRLCDITSLVNLFMSDNHLSSGLWDLSTRCSNLECLDLSNNEFGGALPSFYGMSALDHLYLHGNNFTGSIRADMFHPSMKILVLSHNSFQGPIPQELCKGLPYLEFLDLSYNKLNGSLPSCLLYSFQDMIYLDLNNNRFSELTTFDDLTLQVEDLMTLDLSHNDLIGHIPAWFGSLTSLAALRLKGNRFHGQIPVELCELLNLNILDLSYNNLSGRIPPCFSKVFSIPPSSVRKTARNFYFVIDLIAAGDMYKYYDDKVYQLLPVLIENEVSITSKNRFDTYKGEMAYNMTAIDLSCNRLSGQIPHELGHWSYLHALNFSHNNLWGEVPATFSNLKSIESLDLSYNSLSGRIPDELTGLNTLEVFSVAHNNLSGKIPFVDHFLTFDVSSYEGNPFLCGQPLPMNCTTSESLAIDSIETSENEAEDNCYVDMDTFYVTFVVSSIMMFLSTVAIMLINPHWQRAWFDPVRAFITLGYYSLEDSVRKLRRAMHV